MNYQLRIARPVTDLGQTQKRYCEGLGLTVLGSFEDHQGFDGVILGDAATGYHFEFTLCRHHPVIPHPTDEDLVVFYVPDQANWAQRCAQMTRAGFVQVTSFNPYWDVNGRTFADQDGYRVVIQRAAWSNR